MTVKYQANIETPNVVTGYLVDGIKNVPLAQGNRDYQEVQLWIAEGNIPEDAWTQQELNAADEQQCQQSIKASIAAIRVTYNDKIYSGSEQEQSKIITSMQVLAGKGDTKTRNFFTVDREKVSLTRDDFDNLLDKIELSFEAITDD